MNKYCYCLYISLLILLVPNVVSFAQNDQNFQEEGMMYWDRERGRRSSGMNFTFLFGSSKPKKMSPMKVFDTHAIFDFDQEISTALTNTKELQSVFRKEIRLLDVQIKYLENELLTLIQEHQTGTDRSRQLIETYTQLYKLCDERYAAIEKHTQEMQNILSSTYEQYHTKVQEKINVATEDPDSIITELMDRYAAFQQ